MLRFGLIMGLITGFFLWWLELFTDVLLLYPPVLGTGGTILIFLAIVYYIAAKLDGRL